MDSLEPILDALNSPGAVVSLLVLILWTGARGKWVFGWIVDRMEKTYSERFVQYEQRIAQAEQRGDEWKAAALAGTELAELAVKKR